MDTSLVRPSALAGSWYPDDPAKLRQSIEAYLAMASIGKHSASRSNIRGLILPHAGHRYSGKTCAAGVAAVRGRPFSRLLLIGPSHSAFVPGAVLPAASHFETPLGAVPLDMDAVGRLKNGGIPVSNAPHAREHCIEILLPFFQIALKDFQIVPILVGAMGPQDRTRLAGILRPLLDDRTLAVASSDFVHYGDAFDYTPDVGPDIQAGIRKIDMGAIDRIKSGNAAELLKYKDSTGATICGISPIALLLDLMPESSDVELLDYSQSADISGDTDRNVSYAAIVVYQPNPSPLDARRVLLSVARESLERAARNLPPSRAERSGPELVRKAAVFVTLTKSDNLRGCIGTLQADKPLWRAVQDAAWSAAREDHRFTSVAESELNEILIDITVLSPLKEISSYQHFTPGEHGIVIEKDGRRAVFLPKVAEEMGWDREATLSALCKKAGLPVNAWILPGAQFWIFTGEEFGEADL